MREQSMILVSVKDDERVDELIMRGSAVEIMAMTMVVLQELAVGLEISIQEILEHMIESADAQHNDIEDELEEIFSGLGLKGEN